MAMHKTGLTLAAVLLAVGLTPAGAMVSGFYDSANKIAAIFASEAVADALHQAPVGAVTNTGTTKDGKDIWEIRVQECDLTVYVVGQPPLDAAGNPMPGMVTYTVEIPAPCP